MIAAHDRHEGDAVDDGHQADGAIDDRVVVVDREPVDRHPGQVVELGDRFDHARAAEQLGEGVRLFFFEAQGDGVPVVVAPMTSDEVA